ncbi:Ig-like domain-containing protein [Pseudoalteromonas obscura]|uniref:Cadherin-like domain-containing protein n=1 Tax=Pseudoalteromonas obscura TaxID=3048491 RepID=A0ABT7EG17_9GAMM|nr:Ig-like domain-containing protein [Pseudoalteromonas sp. P94(2023)]MDK2593809.1 cadherin-like domain-containing protein [Pseudoalteromonas sp. P94(2023)]
MTLQTSGPISLKDIGDEYRDEQPHELGFFSEHVSKLPGDTIAISEFYGKSAKTIRLQDKTFEVYTQRSAIIPIANVLEGSFDEYSDGQDPVSLITVLNPQFGTVRIDGANIEFTSTSSVGSAARFDYVVENSIGIRKTHFVTMSVVAVPPIVCNPDTFSLQQGESIYISKQQLIANDEDGSGTGLSLIGVTNAQGGTVSQSGDTITFVSTGLAEQPAQFNYRVRNGHGVEQTGTVYINITPLPEIESFIYRTEEQSDQARHSYSPPTMQDIFNNWARFNGNEYFLNKQDAEARNSTNAKAWYYNAPTDSVVMPLNVSPPNGFVSAEKVDNYTLEATLSSDNTDNDTIGVVAAFVREGSINYVLTIVLNTGGTQPSATGCGVYFGYAGVGAGEKLLGEYNIGTGGGWSNKRVRVKVQRQGDIFKFYVTPWNQTDNFQSASEIVVDLNSDTDLHRFKGKQSYGYITYSQPNSTYLDTDLRGGLDVSKIYDAQNNYVWEYINGSWQRISGSIQSHLGYIRKVFNPQSKERFLISQNAVSYIGNLVDKSQWNDTYLLNETQNVLAEQALSQHGAPAGRRILALYTAGKEEKNYLKDKPSVSTTSAHTHHSSNPGFNNLGTKNWFADNLIDLTTTDFIGGTVVIEGGIVGHITRIGNDNGTSAFVHYQVMDYRLFEHIPDVSSQSL